MSEIFGINASDAGLGALLTLVILFILTGRLVPRRTYDDMVADRDSWRQAFHASEEVRRMESKQLQNLLTVAEMGGRVLTALPQPGEPAEEVDDGNALDQAHPRTRT